MDSRIIIKNFARRISSKLPQNAITPTILPTITLHILLFDIIESILALPGFRSHLFLLRKYSHPNLFRRFILNRVIKVCVRTHGLQDVRVEELSRAFRLAIIDSTDMELIQVIQACADMRDSWYEELKDFLTGFLGGIGAVFFIMWSCCMDVIDWIIGRKHSD